MGIRDVPRCSSPADSAASTPQVLGAPVAAPCPQGLLAGFLKEKGSFQVWGPPPIANNTDNKSRGGEQDGKMGIISYMPQTLEIRKTLIGQILLSVTSPCVTG